MALTSGGKSLVHSLYHIYIDHFSFLLSASGFVECRCSIKSHLCNIRASRSPTKALYTFFSADTFLECILTWSILVMVLLREVYTGGRRRQEDYLFPQPVTSEEEAISCNWPTPPFHTLYYVPSSFICIYMVQQSLIVHGHFVFDSTLFLLNFLF